MKIISIEKIKSVRKVKLDKELLLSIKERGLLHPILLDKEYKIIDGEARFRAAKAAGIKEIPYYQYERSKTLPQAEHRIRTKPVEFARQMKKVMEEHNLTIKEFAGKINRSPRWVKNHLSLLDLIPEAQELVDNGEISLSNAFVLAKCKDQSAYKEFKRSV